MRKFIPLFTLAAAAILLTGCGAGSLTEERGRVTAETAGDELIIPIEGMVCMACVSRVNRTLADAVEKAGFAAVEL